MSQLGFNLKKLLDQANLSENELARRTGISQQIINRIISGSNTNPKLATITPLARYFKVPLHEFILGDISCIDSVATPLVKIPYINLTTLSSNTLENAMHKANHYIYFENTDDKLLFAIDIDDPAMESKFPRGTLLILEYGAPANDGHFCLIKTKDEQYIFRKLTVNDLGEPCINGLNHNHPDFEVKPLMGEIVAILIQSRTTFVIE